MLSTIRPLLSGIGLLLVVWAVETGCTSDAALRRLSPPEQAEFFLDRKAMTGTQEHAYLAEIGLTQRFQALDALDQATIRSGWPRPGMSAAALVFVWGEPYATAGDARQSAHWYYLGSSMDLGARGNQYLKDWYYLGSSMDLGARGNQYLKEGNYVDVYLVEGRVRGWVDKPGGMRWPNVQAS